MRRLAFLLVLLPVLVACEAPAPDAAKGQKAAARVPSWVGMELQRGREPRELVRIGLRGALIGPAGGRLGWKLFADTRRAADSWFFLNTYAPFTRRVPAGELVFRGRGKERAGPVQQRMIFEWARRVAAEAGGSRAGDSYGLIFAWHQGGSSGICEDAVLYLIGEAVATACGWEQEVRGRLDPAQLGRVYGWFDRLRPFQATGGQDEDPRPGTLETRLIFAGRGPRPATAAEQAEISSFSATLFTELSARRKGASPAAVSASEAPATAVSQTPAQRLLLPPGALSVRRGEILLPLPEKPPPVPRRNAPGTTSNPAGPKPSSGNTGEGANPL